MRILQITSDWKWTGPAEPMLRLALALRARGHDLELCCPEAPDPAWGALAGRARAAGLAPTLVLQAARGMRWRRDSADVARLRALLSEGRFEILHAWHTRDHLLALRAAGLRRRGAAPRVVRTHRSAETIAATPWNRWLFGPGSDGLWCVSPGSARANARLRGGRPIAGGFGAVDPARFGPGAPDPRVREDLGLKPEHRVVGVVARVQRHRRFELLLAAAKRLCAADPAARLLVVGRGSHRDEVAVRPAAQMGLSDRVLFAGYRGKDYPEVLRCIDVLTLLVPGSDGSCRAVLEAAACGIPAVVTRRGALPEIVVDGETGRVVDEHPGALARAWGALLDQPERRRLLGEAALQRAGTLFTPARLADGVEALYREVLERG